MLSCTGKSCSSAPAAVTRVPCTWCIAGRPHTRQQNRGLLPACRQLVPRNSSGSVPVRAADPGKGDPPNDRTQSSTQRATDSPSSTPPPTTRSEAAQQLLQRATDWWGTLSNEQRVYVAVAGVVALLLAPRIIVLSLLLLERLLIGSLLAAEEVALAALLKGGTLILGLGVVALAVSGLVVFSKRGSE